MGADIIDIRLGFIRGSHEKRDVHNSSLGCKRFCEARYLLPTNVSAGGGVERSNAHQFGHRFNTMYNVLLRIFLGFFMTFVRRTRLATTLI